MLAALLIAAAVQDSAETPETKRAALAAMTFLECGEMMQAQPTRAAFTAEVRQLAASSTPDVNFTTSGVHLDDADGRGCRVRFSGPAAIVDQVAEAMGKFDPQQSHIDKTLAQEGETVTAVLLDPRP